MFTYTSDPKTVPLDAVRVLIQDVDECEHSLSDEEIEYFLSINVSPMYAAADAMDAMAGKFSRLALRRSRGDVSMDTTARAEQMRASAVNLRARAASTPGGALTGITFGPTAAQDNGVSEKPAFYMGMGSYPRADDADRDR